MSRAIRKQWISALETLKKVNRTLQEELLNENEKVFVDLLADCQNVAIAIGTNIENIYGEGLGCIRILEKYCEAVFQIAKSFNNKDNAIQKLILTNNLLKEAEAKIEKEIKDRLEIVFFPYKAAMWDSLESVYLAAKEDKECDVYCVPIPYYDKSIDGSFLEEHYEGMEFPEYIKITDWRSYDFENRKPDVMYIHNPYDNMNYVTSVHPRFYAENLCQHTDTLVYIPYFVTDEIEPDDQVQIEGMKHFCCLPGIICANKVVLQSENIRQIYINEYMKAAEALGKNMDRCLLEEKFLGIGSPKFDKVLNTRKEDVIK